MVDTIDWNILGACNLRCLYCYGPDKKLKSLPLPILLRIVSRMGEMRVRRVVITGGEPLLTPDITRIFEELRTNTIEIGLSSNGSFVDRYWETINQYVTSLNIPIDGPTAQIHALSRVDTSTFYTNMEILRRCQNDVLARPPKLRIGTVYSATTKGYLKAIAALLLPYADVITTWKIYELINHEMQPEMRAPILHQSLDYQEEVFQLKEDARFEFLQEKIFAASAESRNRAYFMLNPLAQVVVPTKVGPLTVEKVIGHFLHDDPSDLVDRWELEVDLKNYHANHHNHYSR